MRVVALAVRSLDVGTADPQIQELRRQDVECNLTFLGFLIMENMLKGATRETIQTLKQCEIRTVMATGDNTLTAISVARQCNILGPDEEVYVGDVEDEKVVWRSTDESKPPLN